jgi:hypothetical protein
MKTGMSIQVRWIIITLGVGLLTACSSLSGANAEATLEVELTQMATQSAGIREVAQAERTRTVATIIAAETKSADYLHYNNILVGTVRAVQVPTQERLAFTDSGAMGLDMMDTSSGEMQVIQIGTAGYVRPEDGCFESHQSYFNLSSTQSIYLTGVAFNLPAGTRFNVNWLYNNKIVFQDSWSAPAFAERQCFALELTSANAPISAGTWSAVLFVNGEQRDPAPFEVLGE